MTTTAGTWSAQQLTEFLTAVSSYSDEQAAVAGAIEHAAEALEAEVGAVLRGNEVLAAIGFPAGRLPEDQIRSVARAPGSQLDVPGAGTCRTLVVSLEDTLDTVILLARSGDEDFSQEEINLLRGMARVLRLALRGMRVLEAERQLRESSQLQAEENARMADQLRALDEMKNAILTAVSHELRTPLTVVLGLARTLHDREGVLSVPQRLDILRRLTASGEKLERLLSDLLDLDRLGRGIIEPRRVPTDVGDLVRRIVESSQMAGDRPVEFDGVSAMASIDAPKVERIIENLLVNAAKHTPPGSRVVVRVKAESGGIHIAVDDSGPGVPAHLREDIFQPFRQGPQQSPHSPGVGIGLSLVARFAELHGGRAWVEPRPGGGSSFRVFLADETNGSSSPPNPREPFGGEPIKAGGRRHRRTASGGM